MIKILTTLTIAAILLTGCDSLRFAPTESQKQNAWLHNRTAAMTAEAARDEAVSDKLKAMAGLSELQSKAFVSYYGLPKEFPQTETAEDILAESNVQLTRTALTESSQRPNGWEFADNALELAIGICALLGGAYGTKAVQFLKEAKTKSQALKEIIAGNEIFKKQNADSVAAFKQAHQAQSSATRQIVAEMKQ
jgi:hypothetical protein